MYRIANGRVLTRDEAQPYFEKGAVVIEGDSILDVGSEEAMAKAYPNAQVVDACGGVIMPGLINTHTHIYSGLARGLAIDGNNPRNFLQILEGTWWNIDRHLSLPGTKASACATIMACIRNGVTSIFDHHASFYEVGNSLFTIAEASKELGMRSCLCYEVSERDGEEKCAASIRENAEFARWSAEQNSDMIKAMFGGHALFTISDRTFEKMVEANDGMCGFHIHVSEGMNDVWDSLRNYGCRPIERLLYNGILGERTILGHCIHVSPDEMDIIKETKTRVVNCPESNMGNAVGCAPVLRMMEKGITVGMGTDAYTHDMLESLKVFLIIQRHQEGLPNVAFEEGPKMLFENNAAIASDCFGRPLGVLKKGAAADVVVMDYPVFTPFSDQNAAGHMIFGFQGASARTTIINGQILYRDRVFTQVDEEKMNSWILEEAKKLWGALNNRCC